MTTTLELFGVACSIAVVWGVNQSEIQMLKKEAQEHKKHSERLSSIETKLDIILKKLNL
jgi:hypothetical protein